MRIRNHRLRSMMLMLFIGILLFNYVNATMFWHSHVVDGRVITHSHIFWKNHLTGSQDGGHTQGRRADLRAAYLSKSLSQKNLALVKALRSPEVGFNVGYSYNTEVRNEIAPAPLFHGVTVGVSIPLKFSSANKGERVAAEKAAQQADAAYEAALQQIEAEVRMAWSSYKAALLAREKCSDQMLADARTILESRKAAYSQGDSSLLDYLLAVRVYNDTAEACIGAKSAVITAAARLLAAVGCESL